MPVSLYDMMRPVAIAAGLGAGAAGQRGAALVVGGLVGLTAGAIAFFTTDHIIKSWLARERASVGERPLSAAYIAVLAALLVATLAGSYFGHWLVDEKSPSNLRPNNSRERTRGG